MTQVTEQQIIDALRCVVDTDRKKDIISLGMIQGVQIKDGHVALSLGVEPERGPRLEPLRKEVETLVHKLPGVVSASVVLTAERRAGAGAHAAHAGHGHAGHGHAATQHMQPVHPVRKVGK